MGPCLSSNSLNENVAYSEAVSILIKERDRLGKVIRSDRVKFLLTLPVFTEFKTFSDNSLNLNVSSCILGGIDPRSLINKECQDGALILCKDGIFLAGVFDGHGTDGVKIVETVKDLIKSYFLANCNAFRNAGQENIKGIINECDKKVRSCSTIDSSVSGCTAVLLIITDVIHIGSVGDSKAILAMIGSDPDYTPQKRIVDPGRSIVPLKLAVEQRPNIREELERIKKAGGKVQQLTNDQGIKVGPYRVWKKVGTLPGLAMSRSIGDSIGKEIGVISTPVCNSFMFDKRSDLFIVMASDGVWDVMDCQEVINFVEKFRKICQKNPESPGFPVKVVFI
jgi:serine/threonine protein phosphatase PrpC